MKRSTRSRVSHPGTTTPHPHPAAGRLRLVTTVKVATEPGVNTHGSSIPRPDTSIRKRMDEVMLKSATPPSGRAYVAECMKQVCIRETRAISVNTPATFVSDKTPFPLSLDAGRGEVSVAQHLHKDPKVIAFFAKPPRVSLGIVADDGTSDATETYRPDFLVITEKGVAVIEIHNMPDLLTHAGGESCKFYCETNGTWHFPEAELLFQSMGIRHEVAPMWIMGRAA